MRCLAYVLTPYPGVAGEAGLGAAKRRAHRFSSDKQTASSVLGC